MAGCACNSGTDCGCGTNAATLAAAMGGSIGSLVAEVALRLSIGAGPSASMHARNRANAALGLPYINQAGALIVESGASVPVGYGLSVPTGTPQLGRSASWRQAPVTVPS